MFTFGGAWNLLSSVVANVFSVDAHMYLIGGLFSRLLRFVLRVLSSNA
jgi:hypothetical protein